MKDLHTEINKLKTIMFNAAASGGTVAMVSGVIFYVSAVDGQWETSAKDVNPEITAACAMANMEILEARLTMLKACMKEMQK